MRVLQVFYNPLLTKCVCRTRESTTCHAARIQICTSQPRRVKCKTCYPLNTTRNFICYLFTYTKTPECNYCLNFWLKVCHFISKCSFTVHFTLKFLPLSFAATLLCAGGFRLTIKISEWSCARVISPGLRQI